MKLASSMAVAVVLVAWAGVEADETAPGLTKSVRMLASGERPVRIVCFGDSITGVYYHTGGRRAWTDMLGIALKRAYPQAEVRMFNAGISGHTTVNGLARIKKDVLARKPTLVVVMFGMNDVTRVKRETYAENLRVIVHKCRSVGAEVMLCTPNSIYAEDPGRPVARLAAFAESVRAVAKEMAVPLVDCYAGYEAIRAKDALAWKLLMSETIHPNMNGHKLFAEQIVRVVSGKRISLDDVRALEPCIPHTLWLLERSKPIKLIAMPPYDKIVSRILADLNKRSKVTVVQCPIEGKSLAEIEQWSKGIRDRKPDLVVIAVPGRTGTETTTPEAAERFIRSYSWVLDWSLSYGRSEWDVVVVLPSVSKPKADAADLSAEALARRIVIGQDIGFIERKVGDPTPTETLVSRWFRARAIASRQRKSK